MAKLFLACTDAMRLVESSSGTTRATLFRLSVRLGSGEHVDLSGGGSLESTEGVVTVLPSAAASTPCGWLRYLSETSDARGRLTPASFAAEVTVHEDSFDDLLRWIETGSLPDTVILDADALEYGSEPSGNRKLWDIQTSPKLAVRTSSFVYSWRLGSGRS